MKRMQTPQRFCSLVILLSCSFFISTACAQCPEENDPFYSLPPDSRVTLLKYIEVPKRIFALYYTRSGLDQNSLKGFRSGKDPFCTLYLGHAQTESYTLPKKLVFSINSGPLKNFGQETPVIYPKFPLPRTILPFADQAQRNYPIIDCHDQLSHTDATYGEMQSFFQGVLKFQCRDQVLEPIEWDSAEEDTESGNQKKSDEDLKIKSG